MRALPILIMPLSMAAADTAPLELDALTVTGALTVEQEAALRILRRAMDTTRLSSTWS